MKKSLIFLFLSLLPVLLLADKIFQKGRATYYASYLEGRKTSSGERYDPGKMTAAHATLPLNSYVEVYNINNGKSVVVKVNDRMSRKSRFVIDLSKAAAKKIDILRAGMGQVQITKVSKENALAALEEVNK